MHKHGGDIYGNKNVIDFSANINPLGMPEAVKKAALNAVCKSTAYPDAEYRELLKAVSAMEGVEKGNIICGCGAAELVFAAVYAIRPKNALLVVPGFEEYRQALNAVGCSIENYYLKEENGFMPDEEILEFINGRTDMVFICNPNNPTGTVFTKELLLKIIDRCREHDVLAVVDECFNNFMENGEDYTVKGESGVLVLKAFTKMYGMAGLRLGYGITDDRSLLLSMRNCIQPWSVSTVAHDAGLAACACTGFADAARKIISEEKKYLLGNIVSLAEKIYGSGGNFIFFKAEPGLYGKLMEKGIMIRECKNFTGLKEGYYRIAVKNREDNEKLISAWKEVAKG